MSGCYTLDMFKLKKIRRISLPTQIIANIFFSFFVILFVISFLYPPKNYYLNYFSPLILQHYGDSASHITYAIYLSSVGDTILSKEEFSIAFQLSEKNYLYTDAQKPHFFEHFIRQFDVRKELEDNISFWENIVAQYPTYRDGYLNLSRFYYSLNDRERAFYFWKEALNIDPNHAKVRALGALFQS